MPSKSNKQNRIQKRVEDFQQTLIDRGQRWSESRAAIAAVFFSLKGHHSAEDVIQKVQSLHPGLGQATVYRTLNLLVETGFAESHQFQEDAALFEVANPDSHHDHMICLASGRIIEFHDEALEIRQQEVAAQHGYRLVDHKMELYGLSAGHHDDPRFKHLVEGDSQKSIKPLDVFVHYLESNEHKVSQQRLQIAERFFAKKRHWTIPELLMEVQKDLPKLGQATLYRTLALLGEAGLAMPHRFHDKPVSYEPILSSDEHHDHLICMKTGKIVEFYDDKIEAHQSRIAQQHNLALIDHRMELYGEPL